MSPWLDGLLVFSIVLVFMLAGCIGYASGHLRGYIEGYNDRDQGLPPSHPHVDSIDPPSEPS